MSSFSNWITAPTFGYSGKDDYYAAGIIYPWHISQIGVPYISFSSSDDRICKLRSESECVVDIHEKERE